MAAMRGEAKKREAERAGKEGSGIIVADSALVHSACKETCAIHHAKALEEKHGLGAAFPGRKVEGYLRLVWECFSKKGHWEEFRKVWVEECGLI
eukprot:5059909-Pleurochrysis_carterae.AAC.1